MELILDVLDTLAEVAVGCSTCCRFVSRCLWILIPILTLTQTKHETVSRLCSSAFVQYEVHDEFCQNIRSERRQKNKNGMWIPVFGEQFKQNCMVWQGPVQKIFVSYFMLPWGTDLPIFLKITYIINWNGLCNCIGLKCCGKDQFIHLHLCMILLLDHLCDHLCGSNMKYNSFGISKSFISSYVLSLKK